MATYAIGDLQGCLAPLKCLLEDARFSADRDRLWLVGDLINRGPASLDTLRFIYALRDNVTCVLGNHDLHLLAVASGQRLASKGDTLEAILQAPDRDAMLEWLRHRPLLHHDASLGFTMVHAGIPPCWSLADALKRAGEVEQVLRGKHFDSFFANMYGNKPAVWKDSLAGTARWRLITNYFTRMRFCDAAGKLELGAKGDINSGAKGYLPWFAHPQRKTLADKIVFGHWAGLQGQAPVSNVYALDTGCVWGGAMTMLRLEDETYFRCAC
ncbi:symmetrical bis(5'-nucleosyl)-tetraphosphatase [Pseudomaricurvus alcaniphilus]|uniref:symmetrical bis(5'-nucleosyl)-tetraphosphatase n=1 Tax=Pseudomaricurvus alcaniphilus TaxID=1166482 RepID=UPI00140CC7B9|nr:symmetrical bis(5'-nucleosyl)-tetraphosphatase [Pseudomaricurvus alcaniphilus]NHN37040.1 symmetrical bis(5'-nucleosyl)-tetraphosphatase [Pseudomaricurvus alcaniphilus]